MGMYLLFYSLLMVKPCMGILSHLWEMGCNVTNKNSFIYLSVGADEKAVNLV